jgi:hypothetical protein
MARSPSTQPVHGYFGMAEVLEELSSFRGALEAMEPWSPAPQRRIRSGVVRK